jgi:hypothetical protein
MLTNDFSKGNIRMNPSKIPPFDDFKEVLKQWIPRFIDGNPQMGLVCPKLH